ncbi:DUF5710 domain-containing protein [Streptomyces alfalfae]
MADRIWLDVPYADKDRAKKAGAWWDPAAKRWFAPRKGMTELQEWAAAPDVPDLLPGEDRTLGNGLFVDLVPSSCWFTNIRSCVTPQGLGTTPPDDHPPGRDALRSLRRHRGS